jgi:hypothetical protein
MYRYSAPSGKMTVTKIGVPAEITTRVKTAISSCQSKVAQPRKKTVAYL